MPYPLARLLRAGSLGFLGLLVANTTAARTPEVVGFVDLDRYAGAWYEIARIPNRFQTHCHSNVMADYRPAADKRLKVVNSCTDKHGNKDEAHGLARVVDPDSNAKLEVSFVSLFGWRLFWGDYWIFDLAPDYSYAVVGTPDHRFGWILSRTPTLPTGVRLKIDGKLQQVGYSPGAFKNSLQLTRTLTGGADTPDAD